LAAIQGLALTTGRRVVPISTLEAAASGWLSGTSTPACVVACVDGQRGDVFAAAWDCGAGARLEDCRRVIDPCVVAPAELALRLTHVDTRAPLVLVGDASLIHEEVWRAALPAARIEPFAEPLALSAARLALRRGDLAVPPHALKPVYLRRPDAEIARAARAAPVVAIGRAAGAGDVAAVEALQRRAFTNAWGAEAIRWELEHTDVARLYVARAADGSLVAYCACWMVFDELHINSLAVEEGWRRHGVARRLLRHVIADAVGAGARQATLEVRASNRAARRLYETLGFKVEATRRDYYQEPREDALILWHRDLIAPA
jgi:ribosomal-protein-alanine N-acetyltransferase